MKKLCGLKKDKIEKKIKKIYKIVKNPKYICKNCARVASDSKYLCSAIKLK
jgi:hypothetical protein